MSDHCDRLWEIDAHREGRLGDKDAEAFERHLRTCEICARARDRDERLRVLAAELPTREPSDLDLRRLRARVLRDVEHDLPHASAWPKRVAFAFAVAVFSVAVFFAHRRSQSRNSNQARNTDVSSSPSALAAASSSADSTNAFAGTVVPQDDARFTQTRNDAIEHVGLQDGILNLHVRHQTSSEHFFVDLPDGQIEVRGTTFRVEAHRGVTTRVDVTEGVVSVRLQGLDEIWVSAGQTWTRPVAPIASAHPTKTDSSTHSSSTTTAVDPSGSDEYASAVTMMRSGSYDAAAAAFAAFLTAHPKASQAEDASYLEAAALARAGRVDAAALAAEHHLAAYPQSFHAKEAAILVARAARDRGDCDKARSVLAPWLGANADNEALATLRTCASP
jgi:TolA-binding protein